jgi:serine/threonine-protein phosphatase 2A activator
MNTHHEKHEDCTHAEHDGKSHGHHIHSLEEQVPVPARAILSRDDLERFQTSAAKDQYLGFIIRLNDAVKNIPLTFPTQKSKGVQGLLDLSQTLKGWIDEIPPQEVGLSRFGNASFRTWYDRLKEEKHALLSTFVPEEHVKEISGYLQESFGNRKRIDFGTGHEASFMCFLLCLYEVGVLTTDDDKAVVLNVFWDYIKLTRKLQFMYWLEPAGSHGVWGLDDYHFLPFLFGSAQLFDHKYLRPKSIHDKFILEDMSDQYMYFSCIQHINAVFWINVDQKRVFTLALSNVR